MGQEWRADDRERNAARACHEWTSDVVHLLRRLRSPKKSPQKSGGSTHEPALWPIRLCTWGDYLAGALLVSSTQDCYFTLVQLTLIKLCTDLVRLAFSPNDFSPASSIDLSFIPEWTVQVQRTSLEAVRRRAGDELTAAAVVQQ